MTEKETILVWLWIAIAVSVISVSIASYQTLSAGKDTSATETARIKACVDTGASYVGSNCVQVKCVP